MVPPPVRVGQIDPDGATVAPAPTQSDNRWTVDPNGELHLVLWKNAAACPDFLPRGNIVYKGRVSSSRIRG